MEQCKQWEKAALLKQRTASTATGVATGATIPRTETITSEEDSEPAVESGLPVCRQQPQQQLDEQDVFLFSSASTVSMGGRGGRSEVRVHRKAPFPDLLREARRSGDFKEAVVAADIWMRTQAIRDRLID